MPSSELHATKSLPAGRVRFWANKLTCGRRQVLRFGCLGLFLLNLLLDLDEDAELLARVASLLGDELEGPHRPPVLDDPPPRPLTAVGLLARLVVRVLDGLADVIRRLVACDLPPATGHVVQSPG